jgi:PAS domain S-box-containing protein
MSSLTDSRAVHTSHPRASKRPHVTGNSPRESSASTPQKRRQQTNQALENLGQLLKDSFVNESDREKFNKNDILSLTLARLLRRKYWPSPSINLNTQLAVDIETPSTMNDLTGFIIVLNTKGRIILMSDNVEYYLRKNVRSLYPQLTSIYDCVSQDDYEPMQQLLSMPTDEERKIICTWNLPRGKRPSRTHTESKSILMTGHFLSVDLEEQQEYLFVARCEQLLSSTPNIPTNSVGATSTTTLKFVLDEQMNINEISNNTEQLLGYKSDELIDQVISRLVIAEHLPMLEQARQNCILGHHCTTMCVLDLFTRDGDRLTFLCNIHMMIEGRRKTMKIGFLAQLIDSSLRYDCLIYANKQNIERQKSTMESDSSIELKTSTTTNILSTTNEQCLELSNVQPVFPPRRKRRRIHHSHNRCFQRELTISNSCQQAPQYTTIDLTDAQISNFLSDSSCSTRSPIQELGRVDELLAYFDDVFEQDIKPICDFPSIDDVNHILGLNNCQHLFLLTPTMSSQSFFS